MKKLAKKLKGLSIPMAYHHFPAEKKPSIPFMVYYTEGQSSILAENTIYLKDLDIVIEVYNDRKDLSLERKLEDLLDSMKLIYNKVEAYLDDEDLYMIIYEFKYKGEN